MRVLQNLNFEKALSELLPKLLGNALEIVLFVSISSFILAILFGFLLALGRLSRFKLLNGIIIVFQEIIRGTPLLVQLVYIYYVFPLFVQIIAYFLGFPNYTPSLSSVAAGIIGITINYGTYISEVIRSAILGIDKGQTEAALALGFSPRQAMFRIVIPQAFFNSIPVLGNYLLTLVKDTSLMAYITAPELLQTTQAYISQSFTTIESYTIVAVVYLVICLCLSFILKAAERRLCRRR
ncbi:MAG: amino acid ABC transporter permease [Lachnospiraceae bacterium]|nr:amino acid ABC transporter permease [Lachnospiraceae bacterium]